MANPAFLSGVISGMDLLRYGPVVFRGWVFHIHEEVKLMSRRYAGATLAATLLAGSVLAAGALKSGPQPGQEIPGPFHVKNCNGPQAGKSNCQV